MDLIKIKEPLYSGVPMTGIPLFALFDSMRYCQQYAASVCDIDIFHKRIDLIY